MKTAKDVLKSIKDNDVKYVDLRFTDPRGKWQHVTFDISMIDDEARRPRAMGKGFHIHVTPHFRREHRVYVLRLAGAD